MTDMFEMINKYSIQISTIFFYLYNFIVALLNLFYYKNFNYSNKTIITFSSLYIQFVVLILVLLMMLAYNFIKFTLKKDFIRQKNVLKGFLGLIVIVFIFYLNFGNFIFFITKEAFLFSYNHLKSDYFSLFFLILICTKV